MTKTYREGDEQPVFRNTGDFLDQVTEYELWRISHVVCTD